MIVDASAIAAIMHREADSERLLLRLLAVERRMTHSISLYEASMAIARLKGRDVVFGRAEVAEFCKGADLIEATLGVAEASAALDAHARYGKGRHPARLNMGDCFSYAVAKLRRMPLLYKGDDFALTDLA